MPFDVGSFVWEKWRHEWYMGQIIEQDSDVQDEGDNQPRRIKIHIHGEPTPHDKWYDLPHANVVELVQVCVNETAIGVFPQAGDSVELLVMDEPLAKVLALDVTDGAICPLLHGTVHRVYPARDVSIVDVEYPTEYTLVPDRRRRVWVSNGYIRVRRNKALLQ